MFSCPTCGHKLGGGRADAYKGRHCPRCERPVTPTLNPVTLREWLLRCAEQPGGFRAEDLPPAAKREAAVFDALLALLESGEMRVTDGAFTYHDRFKELLQ